MWNAADGGGGLGVLALVPGLVNPPSLVKSAVVQLPLLHVETHDMPRTGLLYCCSSTGELTFEDGLSAEVRRDVLRSMVGFDLVNDVDEVCWSARGDGRDSCSCSGGSSTSAATSSSAVVTGNDGAGMLIKLSGAIVRGWSICSRSFAICRICAVGCVGSQKK